MPWHSQLTDMHLRMDMCTDLQRRVQTRFALSQRSGMTEIVT